MAHEVRRGVRDELLLAVAVVGTVDNWPPGLPSPDAVIEEAAGAALGEGGEHHDIAVEPVDVAFEDLQDVGRERDLPAALELFGYSLMPLLGLTSTTNRRERRWSVRWRRRQESLPQRRPV
ncbi:hypothetical protein [Streptomyces sp. RPA4-5]|uniref:hypothetical protein n=1 Tax=Streptomyces sp. RPA4-5 TaxID=2721245 RepID=UPI002001DECA|nr:hypothetical protein [Streptomyces sp. RPA4-5]